MPHSFWPLPTFAAIRLRRRHSPEPSSSMAKDGPAVHTSCVADGGAREDGVVTAGLSFHGSFSRSRQKLTLTFAEFRVSYGCGVFGEPMWRGMNNVPEEDNALAGGVRDVLKLPNQRRDGGRTDAGKVSDTPNWRETLASHRCHVRAGESGRGPLTGLKANVLMLFHGSSQVLGAAPNTGSKRRQCQDVQKSECSAR